LKQKTADTVRARLVAQEFSDGVKHDELFASTPSLASFRTFMAIAASLLKDYGGYTLSCHDVATAFLHADIKSPVYIRPPPEYIKLHNLDPSCVLRLRKALYGTRQAARCWQDHLKAVLSDYHLSPLKSEPCMYSNQDKTMFVLVHVDDLLVCATDSERLRFTKFLASRVTLNDSHVLSKPNDSLEYLSKRIVMTQCGFTVQSDFDGKLVESLKDLLSLQNCKGVTTPGTTPGKDEGGDEDVMLNPVQHNVYRRAVGIALWLSHDRVDIQYAVKQCCSHASSPRESDMMRIKRLVRYLSAFPSVVMTFEADDDFKTLTVYSDSDWAGDRATRRSTSGGCVYFRSMLLNSWSKSQHVVSLSSAEAELYALCTAVCELLATQHLLHEVGFGALRLSAWIDANATLQNLSRGTSKGMRHVEIKYYFIRDLLRDNKLHLGKVDGKKNTSDLLTKFVTRDVLDTLIALMPLKMISS
jgi:hypothetical protein